MNVIVTVGFDDNDRTVYSGQIIVRVLITRSDKYMRFPQLRDQ